jgi:outer membrane protein assembly factor BamA
VKALLIILLLIPGAVHAQEAAAPQDSVVIDAVVIDGNGRTKDFVILREMSLRPGEPVSDERIAFDEKRIYSLGLFNEVQISAESTGTRTARLKVHVHERWYLFPYPIFGIRDRDWSKVFYGVGVLHNNFRGRNEKLIASLILGYNPSVNLTYRNPFLSDDGSHFFETGVGYSQVRNRSVLAQGTGENFDEQHFGGSATSGMRFGIAHTVWLSLGYTLVDIPDVTPAKTLDPDGSDAFPVFGAGYSFDTRDLREYPGAGSYVRFAVTKSGFPSGTVDLMRYAGDLRQFVRLGGGFVAAGRIFTDLAAAGPTPGYNRVFFGYGERIRGHFKEVFEGESIFGATAELHLPLLEPRYFRVGFLPKEFSVWRFGIVAAAFADAGTVWFRSMPVALDRFLRGYGIGLHFLLPYSFVLRAEYAINEVRKGEFIFDVGAAL